MHKKAMNLYLTFLISIIALFIFLNLIADYLGLSAKEIGVVQMAASSGHKPSMCVTIFYLLAILIAGSVLRYCTEQIVKMFTDKKHSD